LLTPALRHISSPVTRLRPNLEKRRSPVRTICSFFAELLSLNSLFILNHKNVNRYREFYAFPGLELNEIGGTNFLKGMVEWTLPPLRFSSLGWPSLYANWASLSFFGSAIATNLDPDYEGVEVANAGTQLNLKIVFFSSLQTTLSAGYAFAFEEGRGPREELMLSFKILR